MNVKGCNDPARRESVGRVVEERGLDVIIVTETKLKVKEKFEFGKVTGRVSG